MPMVHRGSTAVDFSDDGDGPTVVLLHSSVSGNRQWRRLIELLKSRYRCIAPNLLGYGQTTAWHGHREQNIQDATEVLLAVCDQLPGPIRLVGHSWGGFVALTGANFLEDRISHAVVWAR